MNIHGLNTLSVRTYTDLFLQIKVQWFLDDIVTRYSLPLGLADIPAGCTYIANVPTKNVGTINYFELFGRDLNNNIYYKEFGIDFIVTQEEFLVKNPSEHDNLYVKPNNLFLVKTISYGDAVYYTLNTKGIYMLINGEELQLYKDNEYNDSLYEFNTIFPVRDDNKTKIWIDTIKYEDTHLRLDSSDDVSWGTSGTNISVLPSTPSVNQASTSEYVTHINGVHMNTGAVSVVFALADKAKNTFPLPSFALTYEPITQIPKNSKAPESYQLLPIQITGVLPNKQIYSNYNFNVDSFNNVWVPDIIEGDLEEVMAWYTAAQSINANWVTLLPGIPDKLGIADLALKVDGNVGTVPALTANTVGYMPEYRLFNANFTVKKTTKRITEADQTGYFKLIKKGSEAQVGDGDTSGKCLAIVVKDGEQKEVWVSSKQFPRGTVYLTASLPEDGNVHNAQVKLNHNSSTSYVPVNDPFTQHIIIGRITKSGTRTKIRQDHAGVAYFDFSNVLGGLEDQEGILIFKDGVIDLIPFPQNGILQWRDGEFSVVETTTCDD